MSFYLPSDQLISILIVKLMFFMLEQAHTSLTVKVYYQAAYAMIITVDVFIICTVVTHLFEQVNVNINYIKLIRMFIS